MYSFKRDALICQLASCASTCVPGLTFTYYSYYQPKLAKVKVDHPFIAMLALEHSVRKSLPFYDGATVEEYFNSALFAARVIKPTTTAARARSARPVTNNHNNKRNNNVFRFY